MMKPLQHPRAPGRPAATPSPKAVPGQPPRRVALVLMAGTALALAGCAGMHTLTSEVSSFGEWPADRAAGSYAFERLPSQQARAAETDRLEEAARTALAKAGFKPAAEGAAPDVLVQVGTRVGRAEAPWADPFWWRGGFGYWRPAPWGGSRWALSAQFDLHARYDLEVAVLLRDRASGKPLYESRASVESSSSQANTATLAALFQAALMDFPRLGVNPRRVTVTMAP